MANNVYFFQKTTSRKVVAINLILSIQQIEFLVKEKGSFSEKPRARMTHIRSILTQYDLYKLGYVAISANQYRLLRDDVLGYSSCIYKNL